VCTIEKFWQNVTNHIRPKRILRQYGQVCQCLVVIRHLTLVIRVGVAYSVEIQVRLPASQKLEKGKPQSLSGRFCGFSVIAVSNWLGSSIMCIEHNFYDY